MSKELVDKFIRFEEKHNLFEYQLLGVNVWPIIRFRVYSKIYQIVNQTQYAHPKQSLKKAIPQIVKTFFISIWKAPFFLGQRDVIIINHKRKIRNDEGYYECKYSEYLNSEDCYVLEAPFNEIHPKPSKTTKQVVYIDLIINVSRIYSIIASKRRLPNKDAEPILSLQSLIEKEFAVSITDFKGFVIRAILKHKALVVLWSYVLKRVKPKKAYVVVAYSDINMPFIEVAKDMGIRVIELQHGIMGDTHIAYNFASKSNLNWYPDEIWVWNDYWAASGKFPVSTENILSKGFPFLDRYKKSFVCQNDNKKQILIISQGPFSDKLIKIASELNDVLDSTKYNIGFKAHPSEVEACREKCNQLKQKGVNILEESNIYVLFRDSYCQIGVNSTALFEGLEFGLKTFILKTAGSEVFENVEGVVMFEKVNEILDSLED